MSGGALALHRVFCGWETWHNLEITRTLMDVSQALNFILMWFLSLRPILTYCIQLWLPAEASFCDNDFVLF